MIYLFTWNSEFLVRNKTLSWKNQYIKKYWDFNLIHFKDISKIDNNSLNQELLWEWFMWEKKLIIIDNLPLWTKDKSSDLQDKQNFIESILDNIPLNNIVLFSSANIDKRSKFYKKLNKLADKIEEFNYSWENEVFWIVSKKYKNEIDNQALNLLIKYKSSNLEKIIWEIEKLLITKDKIIIEDIKNNIFPELEESIFQLIDDIMNENILKAINKIEIILTQTNVYAFYNNLLANLRVLVFIKDLKSKNIDNISEILDLKNRSFLVNKNYKISKHKLNNLYIWLIDLDKKMKSGKMIASEDEVLKYEIEKEILKIKN